MALNVAQVEEIAGLLREVPRLVDEMQARRAEFVADVLAWLKRAETALESNRLPAVSQVSSCRAALLQATRGAHTKDLAFTGRATLRKVAQATASVSIERASQLLNGAISERQAVFQEAERLTRRVIAVAEAKGIVRTCASSGDRHAFLQCVRQKVADDADLASVYVHLIGLVGKSDVVVFLDRAID